MKILVIIISKVRNIIPGLVFMALLSSCYEEHIVYPEPGSDAFNFLMTLEQEELIISSRREKHLITDPNPILHYSGQEYGIDRLQIRGASSLNYQRKSFSVNIDGRLSYFIEDENRERDIEKFKLLAMVFDYTYVEEGIALEILKRNQLWPLFNFYTEVKLNSNTQGLYLFVEDPEDFYLYNRNAPIIMRRDYHNYIIDYELNELIPTQTIDQYKNKFNSIYNLIIQYDGKQLYDSLIHYIDIEEYCRKIAVDMLLQNGDYTDEVYFYIKVKEGREVFGVAPWDYDDIFSELPHEVGRTWGSGTLFGTRVYKSMEDVYADVGHKLLFSIEDDLDYKIARDSVLYQIYLGELEKVLETLDNSIINEIFLKVRSTLQPFYERPELIEQSKYDYSTTSVELFETNLIDKEQFLMERRAFLIQELNQQKTK